MFISLRNDLDVRFEHSRTQFFGAHRYAFSWAHTLGHRVFTCRNN